MFVPLTTTSDPNVNMMFVLINQFKPRVKPGDKGIPCNFSSYSMPCMNRLFQNQFVNSIHIASFMAKHLREVNEESTVLTLVDKILASGSMESMIKNIKTEFKTLFGVERVNVLLVNRFHKFFFKIKKDKKTKTSNIVRYEMQQGLAGHSAASGQNLLSETVSLDVRFKKELDDPKGTVANPAYQILTQPIYTRDDAMFTGKDALQNYPRIIV